jgi:hypothetical protein
MSIKYYYSLISFFIPIHKLVLFNSKSSSYYFFKVMYHVVFSRDQYEINKTTDTINSGGGAWWRSG